MCARTIGTEAELESERCDLSLQRRAVVHRRGEPGTVAAANFVGIGVHCAIGSAACAAGKAGRTCCPMSRAATTGTTARSAPSTSIR
jgi:hypothetical protein